MILIKESKHIMSRTDNQAKMSKWGRHGALTHPAWMSPPLCPPVPESRTLKTLKSFP